MKKKFLSFILTILALLFTTSTLFACGGSSWKAGDLTLKDGGEVVELSLGGFVAETDKYIYFINGISSSSNENKFGTPIKGSLMVADKSNLSKSEVVVPKLFVASDYKAGVYIFDGYVYYASPSTSKNSTGNIANDKLTFFKTKLDGSGKTEEFFTVTGISTEYRIVKGENAVYIIYYDSENSSLISYNATTKNSSVIAKTDTKANGRTMTSNSYKFVENSALQEAVVYYTVTVYAEDYNEESAKLPGYSRKQKSYNRIYAYKAGDDVVSDEDDFLGKVVLDGNQANNPKNYSITQTNGDLVFVKETTVSTSETKTKAVSIADLYQTGLANAKTIVREDLVTSSSIIKAVDEVYTVSDGVVKKVDLEKLGAFDEVVAKSASISTIVLVENDYLYYSTTDGKLARTIISKDATEDSRVEELISSGSFANSWFAPEFADGKLFYCDNSATGSAYIKYVDIENASVKTEEDKDGNKTYSLENVNDIGKITDSDVAKIFKSKLDSIPVNENTELEWEIKDGAFVIKALDDIKAEYNKLKDTQKALLEEETVEKYNILVEAGEFAEEMYKFYEFNNKSTEDKNALKEDFQSLNAKLEALKEKDLDKYKTICSYIENDLNYYFFEEAKAYEFA